MIDWTQLARDVGSLGEEGDERGGTEFAQRALERVIGEDSLRAAVELVLSQGRGSELAMNVLRHGAEPASGKKFRPVSIRVSPVRRTHEPAKEPS